jgi:hypothetical protein
MEQVINLVGADDSADRSSRQSQNPRLDSVSLPL